MVAKVSTIIPAYNAGRTIADTVDSALAQRYEGNEVVVVDDGSTDSTAALLSRYGNRIRVVTQPNRGAAAARNAGVAQSNGKYLAFLDSDDIWLPGKLEAMISALERNPRASLAFSEYGFIDESGRWYRTSSIGTSPSFSKLMTESPFFGISMSEGIMPSTWVLPRPSFDATGGFCEAFKNQGWEDNWILVLLRDLGEFVYVPERLTLYRVARSIEMADKYGQGVTIFVTLVKKRYGLRGRALARGAKNLKCRWLLTKIAHQMDRGDRLGAVSSLAQIVRLRPGYFLTEEFTNRLQLPQNRKRIRDIVIVRTRS
jgi:glycosyltransferase involved in cell wall biosynthesis